MMGEGMGDGLFIAFEGLDGAGTTTQAKRLLHWLEAREESPHLTREPSDGPIGKLIRRILAGEWASVELAAVALLFAADRLDHLAREVRPHVKTGGIVITSLAYQGRHDNADWGAHINVRADDPDLTLFLDVPVDVCLARVGARGGERDIYERRDTLEEVDAMYRQLIADRADDPTVHVLDGTQSMDAIEAQIREIVSRALSD